MFVVQVDFFVFHIRYYSPVFIVCEILGLVRLLFKMVVAHSFSILILRNVCALFLVVFVNSACSLSYQVDLKLLPD